MGEERLVTEVPSSLKQLARLVVRGFYTIEDALIVDMLVRNPCEYICLERSVRRVYSWGRKLFKVCTLSVKPPIVHQRSTGAYCPDPL
jgi:hypothetical protein